MEDKLSQIIGKATWVGLLAIWVGGTAHAEDNCADILRDGAFNFSSSSSRSQFAKNLVKHYCSSSATEEGGEIEYEGVGVGYDAARRKSVCKDSATSTSKLSERYEKTLEASATLAETWLQCMNRDGLHASTEVSGTDANQFYLEIRRRNGGANQDDTISIRVADGEGLTCKGLDFANAESISLPGTLLYPCKREDPFKTYTIAISSDSGDTAKAQVPGLPEPEPEPEKPATSPGIATFSITSRSEDHDGSCETLLVRVVTAGGHAMTRPMRAPGKGKTASISFRDLPLNDGLQHVEIRMKDRGECESSDGRYNKMIVDKALLAWTPPNQKSTTQLAYCGKNFRLDGDVAGGGTAILRPGTGGGLSCYRENGNAATKDN